MSTKKSDKNNAAMQLTDEARVDMSTYAALLERRWETRGADKLRPLYAIGPHGIGKSQTVYQVAERLSKKHNVNVKALCVSMHCLEAPDWNGLSYVMDGKTLFAHPALLPSDGHGILFLDELNRAPKDLLQAALTLIENREINGHKLGDGWIITCAGNPTQDMTSVMYSVKELDPALKDRLTHYVLAPKVEEVLTYLGNKYGESNPIIRWLKSEPNVLCMDGTGKTSPRAMEYVIRSLRANEGLDRFVIMAGEVGNSAAIQFQKYLTSPASVDLSRLLAMDDEVVAMMREFHAMRKKALEEGKVNDVSVVNQWIALLKEHLGSLKADFEAKHPPNSDGTPSKEFSLKDRPELAASLAKFMYNLDVFEWVSTFNMELGWLFLNKDSMKTNIFGPIFAAEPKLMKKIEKIFEESTKREEAENKRKELEDKAAAKAAEKKK